MWGECGGECSCNLLSMSKKSQIWRRAALSYTCHGNHARGRPDWVAKEGEREKKRERARARFWMLEDRGLARGRMIVA